MTTTDLLKKVDELGDAVRSCEQLDDARRQRVLDTLAVLAEPIENILTQDEWHSREVAKRNGLTIEQW